MNKFNRSVIATSAFILSLTGCVPYPTHYGSTQTSAYAYHQRDNIYPRLAQPAYPGYQSAPTYRAATPSCDTFTCGRNGYAQPSLPQIPAIPRLPIGGGNTGMPSANTLLDGIMRLAPYFMDDDDKYAEDDVNRMYQKRDEGRASEGLWNQYFGAPLTGSAPPD